MVKKSQRVLTNTAGPFTGACFMQGIPNTGVPTGGNSASLWNRATPAGIPLEPGQQVLGSYDMTRQLQDAYGQERLYRKDTITLPPSLTPACAAPPFVPQPSMNPVDLTKRDFYYPMPQADPLYAQKLFIDDLFLETPIIGNQQLAVGSIFNTVTV